MYKKSLEINERLGKLEGMANDYGNLGIVYKNRGDLNNAERMYLKSLDIEQRLGRLEGMASDYGNLGDLYKCRGDLDRAEESYKKSHELFQQIGSGRAEQIKQALLKLRGEKETE